MVEISIKYLLVSAVQPKRPSPGAHPRRTPLALAIDALKPTVSRLRDAEAISAHVCFLVGARGRAGGYSNAGLKTCFDPADKPCYPEIKETGRLP